MGQPPACALQLPQDRARGAACGAIATLFEFTRDGRGAPQQSPGFPHRSGSSVSSLSVLLTCPSITSCSPPPVSDGLCGHLPVDPSSIFMSHPTVPMVSTQGNSLASSPLAPVSMLKQWLRVWVYLIMGAAGKAAASITAGKRSYNKRTCMLLGLTHCRGLMTKPKQQIL